MEKMDEMSRFLKFYETMVKIRTFEQKADVLFSQNVLPGFLHLYIGEEAIATGVCAALEKTDYITSTHRGHGHLIAKGGDVKKMFAELLGRETGYCKGKGGSMHICDMDLGILGSNGIVGAGMPIATGAAYASWYRNDGRVAVSFFGDGASNRGTFHESLNMASALKLPVIFVCENNLFGVSVDCRKITNVEDLASRAAGYGVPGVVADGNNVEEVYRVTKEAVDRARRGEGPTMIEFKTWRHFGHFVGDPCNYRDPAEHTKWLKEDPLPRFEKILIEKGYATEADMQKIKDDMHKLIDDAFDMALAEPEPSVDSLMDNVFSN